MAKGMHASPLDRLSARPEHRILYAFCVACFIGLFCAPSIGQAQTAPISPARVLVVENTRSPDSLAIAHYYVKKRRIPEANVCRIVCPTDQECSRAEYHDQIETPIRRFLAAHAGAIDYIVLTKGMPIRMHEGPAGGFSIDSVLAAMDWPLLTTRTPNPYFARNERFSHARFHLYLVTRFIGYTLPDCLRLIDNALAAKPGRGIFLIHTGPGHESAGYKAVNDGMREAAALLLQRHFETVLDTGDTFPGGYKNLMGYYSWGSNDSNFDKTAYRSLTFAPGAIADTAVSTSGRTFEDPEARGQSLIGDLIAQGVTGCKGYVSEPYADSISHADILFARYTAGYTLAESFYMASQYVYWKDMVIGDPLCAPYAK